MKLLVAVRSVGWFLFLSLLFWNCNIAKYIFSNFRTVLSSHNRIVKLSTDRRQPAYRPRFHVCLLLLQSSLPPPTPLHLYPHPHPCPHNILPPPESSPLSDVSKSTQAVLPHVTMHRRVHRCSPLFSPPSSRAREGTPKSSQSSFPARPTATATASQQNTCVAREATASRMRARPAGIIGPAKSDERGRITFHDASKAKECVRPRPPSLTLSVAPSPSSSME